MIKLHLHFFFMISIFIIAIINAFRVISCTNCNLFLKFLSVICIFLIIYVSMFKETFLPFLGDSAFPVALIPNQMHPPQTNFSIDLDFNYPDGSKVVYWSANPNPEHKTFETPQDAYGDYKNSGVAIVNNRKAILHLNCPDKYKVPTGMVLDKHIHYRVAMPNNPIISGVKTIFIKC
jgi:hypothetical protein